MKLLKLASGLALSLIFLPAMLLAGANLPIFDEELNAAAKGIIESKLSWQDDENAWRYLYGISADNGELVLERADRILNMMQEQVNTKDYDASDLNRLLASNEADIAWLALYPALSCRIRDDRSCLIKLRQELSENRLPERAETMLARYRHMASLQKFVEPDFMNFQSPLPQLSLAMELSKLHLALANNESEDAFFDALENDFRFWRMAIRTSESLIGKMIANAAIHRNLLLLSLHLKSNPDELSAEKQAKLLALLVPLSPDELDIAEAYHGELRGLANSQYLELWVGPSDLRELMVSFAYQPNATVNDIYEFYIEPSMSIAKLDGLTFWKAVAKNENEYPGTRIFPPSIYNLSGKLMLSETLQASFDYIARMHNLQGMYGMLNLQLRANSENLQELINNEKWANPFTGEPFFFDSATLQLSFECYKRNPEWCEINL